MADPTTSGLGGLGGQFWSTLLGAIVGAATSGAVSWRLQTSAAKAARDAEQALRDERGEVGEAEHKERLLEKRQKDLLLAHSITFKLIAMLTAITHTDSAVQEAKLRIGPIQNQNSWLLFTPIANRFPQQGLERDEQSLVASFKKGGLTGKVVECFYLYNDFIFLLESYKIQRFDVLHRIAANRVGKMNMGSEPNLGELSTYEPLIIPVRQLAQEIIDRSSIELASTKQTLTTLTRECNLKFGSDFGTLSDVDAQSSTSS